MGKKRLQYMLIGVLAVLIAGVSFYGYWQKNTTTEVTSAAELVDSPKHVAAAPKSQEEVVVYISGPVNQPGVIRISPGMRVIDAVNAAGGLAQGADVSKVNLAQHVKDGMHIRIPGETMTVNKGQQGDASEHTNKISINTANASELDQLPGVGPALASRIIEYRQSHGSFKDISELKNVSGIGNSKFNKLKDKITL